MQQSQRPRCNHALEYAIQCANDAGLPTLVAFGLTDRYPDANARHYRFMLEGLADTQALLARRGIAARIEQGPPAQVAARLGEHAAMIVCDRGYLRHQRRWRRELARAAGCRVIEVETDVVVPVEVASGKPEHAARTLRPKLHRHLPEYLVGLRPTPADRDALGLERGGLDLSNIDRVLAQLDIDRSVPPTPMFVGGPSEAARRLRRFIERDLAAYATTRDQPHLDGVSHLSMYLHFGHISPLEIALAVRAAAAPEADRDAYLEQLIVRRELAHNFVWYTRDYDRYTAVPRWARATLTAHADDPREHRYTRRQLEDAQTHDPYWNAAMREMRHVGYLHNHMRMYWGKRILAWASSPAHAFRVALSLNNRYFLDGRDPSSYANVAWLFGLHDRPWPERAVFGKVRTMTPSGLERKIDTRAYLDKVRRIT